MFSYVRASTSVQQMRFEVKKQDNQCLFMSTASFFTLHNLKNGLLYSTFKYKYGQIVWVILYEFSFALLFKIISTKVKEK